MYEALKGLALKLLKVPAEPPEEPAGAHESVVVFRASPRYLTYLMIPMVVSVMAMGLGLGMGEGIIGLALWKKGFLGIAAAVWAVGALLILLKAVTFYVTTRLNYELRWYLVTDRSLRIREGVWLVREVTLTFANVQNINVLQGPLQRWFGISDLIVETAGGGTGKAAGGPNMMLSHHGVLRGIENATEVRDRIQNLLRAYRASGLGDPEEKHAAPAPAGEFGGEALEALRELRDETKMLRAATAR
jgi:membrane protein YdbS with pleckstrin-like domain